MNLGTASLCHLPDVHLSGDYSAYHMLLYLQYEEMIEREHMSKNNSEAIIFIDENVSSKTVHLETFKEVLQWTSSTKGQYMY